MLQFRQTIRNSCGEKVELNIFHAKVNNKNSSDLRKYSFYWLIPVPSVYNIIIITIVSQVRSILANWSTHWFQIVMIIRLDSGF